MLIMTCRKRGEYSGGSTPADEARFRENRAARLRIGTLLFRSLAALGRLALILLRRFGGFLVPRPHLARHFEASQQIGVARRASHRGFGNTMPLVVGRKGRPFLDHCVAIGLFRLQAFLESHGAQTLLQARLIGKSAAKRLYVEGGILVGASRQNR